VHWADAHAQRVELAPAVRKHVFPQLVAAQLL